MEAPNLNIHVDPKLMQQAERILSAIGVSKESAVDMLFRHIVMENGLPFETKLPAPPHLCADRMTDEEVDNMIIEAMDSMEKTSGIPFEKAFAEIYKEIGIQDCAILGGQ